MGLGLEMGNPKGHLSYGHWYFGIPYDELVRARCPEYLWL